MIHAITLATLNEEFTRIATTGEILDRIQ